MITHSKLGIRLNDAEKEVLIDIVAPKFGTTLDWNMLFKDVQHAGLVRVPDGEHLKYVWEHLLRKYQVCMIFCFCVTWNSIG